MPQFLYDSPWLGFFIPPFFIAIALIIVGALLSAWGTYVYDPMLNERLNRKLKKKREY